MTTHPPNQNSAGEVLLPCPWCGDVPSLRPLSVPWWNGRGEVAGHIVSCGRGACPAEAHVFKDTEAAAIAAWNTRVDGRREQAIERLNALPKFNASLLAVADPNATRAGMADPRDYGEPWVVSEDSPPGRLDIVDKTGNGAREMACLYEEPDPYGAQERADRLVACVNACKGMADPAAEIERLREVESGTDEMLREAQKAYATAVTEIRNLHQLRQACLAAADALGRAASAGLPPLEMAAVRVARKMVAEAAGLDCEVDRE